MSKVALFQFSGTGNTCYIARLIQQALAEQGHPCNVYSIEQPLDVDAVIADHDIAGFGYPIYGSDLPDPFHQFITRIGAHPGKRAFVFCTQYLYSGDGAACGARLLEKKGFVARQLAHFNMPNNMTDFRLLPAGKTRRYGALRETKTKQVKRFVERILHNRRRRTGANPLSLLLGLLQRVPFRRGKKKYADALKVEDSCVQCGKCVTLCPVDNLKLMDNRIVPQKACVFCYRCINHCPTQALHLARRTRVKTPYHGPQPDFRIEEVREHHVMGEQG